MNRHKKNRKKSDQDFFLGNMLSDEQFSVPVPTDKQKEAPVPKDAVKQIENKKKPSEKAAASPSTLSEKTVEKKKRTLGEAGSLLRAFPRKTEEKPSEDPFEHLAQEASEKKERTPEETGALLRALSQEKEEKPSEDPFEHPIQKSTEKKTSSTDSMWNEDLWKKEEEPPKKPRFLRESLSKMKKSNGDFVPNLEKQEEDPLPTEPKQEKSLSEILKTVKERALPALKTLVQRLPKIAKAIGTGFVTGSKKYAVRLVKILRKEKEEIRRKHLEAIARKKAEKEAAEQAAKDAAEREAAKKAEAEFRKKYNAVKTHLLSKRAVSEKEGAASEANASPLPKENESLDLTSEKLRDYLDREGALDEADPLKKKGQDDKKAKKPHARRDIAKAPLTGEEAVKASLDGMYGVYRNPKKQKKKKLRALDYARYAFLFVCIFGFFSAGFFVFRKVYDYYRAHVIYSGLQEMVSQKDYFAHEYLKKASVSIDTLTPEEVLAGKKPEGEGENVTFTEEQETLVNKIARLKKINPDTAGWISIDGTVVDYPLVWSAKRNYYLHRDFYGKTLSGGAIFIDERNDPDITKNRNTVIYGHNMADGSMFASVHDYASASVFYGTKIEIATQNGIYVYTPFSVHHSNAFDNYFETDFVSDEDFIDFCEQMAFLSLHETDFKFNKNTQIITLSTCMDNETATEERFAVHAILTQVIR